MYTVYILENKQGLLYKGYTADLQSRLVGHKSGKNPWTRSRGPWKLVYQEEFNNKKDAILREKFFKSGKGREYLKSVLSNPASA